MDQARVAARIASAIEGAIQAHGLDFIRNRDAHVAVDDASVNIISHASVGDTPSALINRRPEAAALYEAIQLRDDLALKLGDNSSAEAIDETIVRPAVDRLARALATIIEEHRAAQLETAPKHVDEKPSPPLKKKSPLGGIVLGVVILVVSAVVNGALKNTRKHAQVPLPAPAQQTNVVDPFAAQPSSDRGANPYRAAATQFVEEQRWPSDVAAFFESRCELQMLNDQMRVPVSANRVIFQRALDEVAQPGMTNQQLLQAAGERVYAYQQYTPRGYCPSPASEAPTVALDLSHEGGAPPKARAKKPRCEYSGVMSDEEIARCR